MKIKKIILLMVIFIALATTTVNAQVFSEAEIATNKQLGKIYIIGNENLGEIESYNKEEKTYTGLMPELFKKIEETSGLELEYLEINTDREQEIKNNQAEIISVTKQEEVTEKIKVFTLPDGEEIYIGFTEIANTNVKDIVKKAVDGLTGEEREKIILTTLEKEVVQKEEKDYKYIIITIALVVLVVCLYIRKLKKQARKQKYTDNITQHSNYENFKKSFEKFINDEVKASYCLVDLGIGITHIEEIYGYKEIENILKDIANILDEYTQNNEMFCRKTNNSFLLLLDYISQKRLEERLTIINEAIQNYTSKYELKVSCGIYYLKSTDDDIEMATYYAMQAKRNSEETGKLYTACNKSLIQKIDEDTSLEKDVLDALKRKEFVSYVQPIINIREGQVFALEFVARWENEQHGFIKPRKFLKILEKNNLLYDLDMLMFNNACESLEILREDTNKDIIVFCNFSRNSFAREGFIDNIKQSILEHRIKTNQLGIVVTEDILSNHTYNIKKIINELKNLGLLIVLDNFGGTEDSINDIAELDCDFIKIAPKLLNNLESEKKRDVLNKIISLAQNLKIEVICENIEKAETESLLSQMNCKLLQGNLYCQAIPIEQIENMYNNKE